MAAETPQSVRIRAYDVGFGDCFLLTFVYPSAERHVLIDFGSFPKPKRQSAGNLPAIARHIQQTCGGKLAAVVATHRHADHINGFATTKKGDGSGDVIRACRPDVVVQPWTEQLDAATDSPGPQGFLASDRAHVKALADMVRFREALLRRLRDPHPGWKGVSKELGFLGEDGLGNRSAVLNLESMAPKAGRRYVFFGAESGLGAVLPGVKVRVLGPPTISQSDGVEAMKKHDDAEFWHILAATSESGVGAGGPPFSARYRRKAGVPGFAQWLVGHADKLLRDQVLSIVRRMDDYLNNTSVILLFEVGGKKLLFPGDAQIENWSYALSKPEIRALLTGVDVYKVGHHGSLNATPKSGLWERFSKRRRAKNRLITFLSTEPGHHGTAKSHTEVPRVTLVKALEDESELFSTTEGKKLTRAPGVAFIEHEVRV
jgi:hypothetical protein